MSDNQQSLKVKTNLFEFEIPSLYLCYILKVRNNNRIKDYGTFHTPLRLSEMLKEIRKVEKRIIKKYQMGNSSDVCSKVVISIYDRKGCLIKTLKSNDIMEKLRNSY